MSESEQGTRVQYVLDTDVEPNSTCPFFIAHTCTQKEKTGKNIMYSSATFYSTTRVWFYPMLLDVIHLSPVLGPSFRDPCPPPTYDSHILFPPFMESIFFICNFQQSAGFQSNHIIKGPRDCIYQLLSPWFQIVYLQFSRNLHNGKLQSKST